MPTRSDDPSGEQDSLSSGDTLLRKAPASEHAVPAWQESRYQVDENDRAALLGRGGQGMVWRAWDAVLRREVALKKLHPDALSDVAAFLREARLTASLEHPGIVSLHDVGRGADGSLYLALRRIEGRSLADSLAEAPGLDGRLRLVPSLVRACQAVAFAHGRGVVHCDLKPQNVMLGPFGETYVIDWGLALVTENPRAPDVTAPLNSPRVVGSPAYMSPEQALGLPADARSDVWGMGACLYQLLTGQPPITGRTLQSAVGHAAQGQVSPVLALEPRAPADLAAICDKALCVDRSGRYADASKLAADLESWLAGRTVSAVAYTRAQLLRRALSANRGLVGTVALGLALLVGVLGMDELRVRRERNEARTFARQLIHDLPQQFEASRANIRLLNVLTERTQQWLGRSDLSLEEQADLCSGLSSLASLNSEAAGWAVARDLYTQASQLSLRGLAAQPDNPTFLACEVEAKAGLAECALETGDEAGGLRLYEEASQTLTAWRGAWPSRLRAARAALHAGWGTWAWVHEPEKARRLYADAAEVVIPLLDSPSNEERRNALSRGGNAIAALWSEGRLPEAVALAKRFQAAAEPDCAEKSLVAQRSCRQPLQSYASVLAWVDAPEAAAVRRRALEVDAWVLAHDVNSNHSLYDSMVFRLEVGLFAEATQLARQLRAGESASWGQEMGPLVAVMSGDLAEVDAWEARREEGSTEGQLAFGLRDAARGQYAQAAAQLRKVQQEHLWYRISWPPHPTPTVQFPAAARPAFERFLSDFTRAYGAADMKRLGGSIDELAAALESLR